MRRSKIEGLETRRLLADFGSISGIVFSDVNSNGTRDPGEAGLAGRTVYIDANNNETLDTGERRAITAASGEYVINEVTPGTYRVRQVLPAGNTQTAPTGNASLINFVAGQRAILKFGVAGVVRPAVIEGRVFRDANNNAAFDEGEPGQANVKVYLDYNNSSTRDDGEPQAISNSNGNYRLESTRTGTFPLRLNLASSDFQQTLPINNGAREVTLVSGQVALPQPFGVRLREQPVSAVVEGRVFRDANNNGALDPNEVGAAGISVYLDYNNDSVRQAGEPQAATNASGNYRLVANRVGVVSVRLNLTSAWVQTLPANSGARTVTLVNGQAVDAERFGIRMREEPVSAVAEGRVINDANNNGAIDDGEAGVANISVYLDFNNNARRDDGEPAALTNANGNYRLVATRVGSATVRLNLPADQWRQTLPADGGRPITLNGGSAVNVLPFGIRRIEAPRYSVISGSVFNDANRNGIRDAGETGRANVVVFIDRNANGILDGEERSRTTESNGFYRFLKVKPGRIVLRIVTPANQVLTTPAGGMYSFTAVAGRTYGERIFGLAENVSRAARGVLG